MNTEVRCPYCNSKDLAKIPTPAGATTIVYKCLMCGRTFSKSTSTEKQIKPQN